MDSEEERRRRDRSQARHPDSGQARDIIWGQGSAQRKRRLIRKALLEDAAWSNRMIGYWVGCDHKTAAKVRREMEAAGEIACYICKGGGLPREAYWSMT